MVFFNFGLEQKLVHHSCVEFHSDSDNDGFNFPKPQINPSKCPQMVFFNFGLEQKLDHYSCKEIHSDSDGDGFKTQKLMIDLLIVLKCISIIVRIPETSRGLEFASQLWLLSLIRVLASTRALLEKKKKKKNTHKQIVLIKI